MRLIGLAVVLAVSLLAPLAAEGQQAAKPPRVGYLGIGSASADAELHEAFREGLREHGWIDGQNMVIEYRWPEGRLDRLPDLAAELVRQNVHVIFAPSTASTVAAKNATRTIPIVMAMVGVYRTRFSGHERRMSEYGSRHDRRSWRHWAIAFQG